MGPLQSRKFRETSHSGSRGRNHLENGRNDPGDQILKKVRSSYRLWYGHRVYAIREGLENWTLTPVIPLSVVLPTNPLETDGPALLHLGKTRPKPARLQRGDRKPSAKPSIPSVEEATDAPSEEQRLERSSTPQTEPVEKPQVKLEGKPAEKLEKPEEKPAEKLEKPEEKPAEKLEEKPAEKLEEKPAGKLEEKAAVKLEEKPAVKLEESPVKRQAEGLAEKEEKPKENLSEEKPKEQPGEGKLKEKSAEEKEEKEEKEEGEKTGETNQPEEVQNGPVVVVEEEEEKRRASPEPKPQALSPSPEIPLT